MIQNIIFSRNRAQQLRNLLISIQKNCPNIFNINVLYDYSTPEYEMGYNRLKSENILPNINWIKQTDFKLQVLNLLQTNSTYSCFGTDDGIFYHSFDESIVSKTLQEDQGVFCFSLRLGKNVSKCYTQNCDNVLIPLEEYDNLIKWDWTKHYCDFSYPLSVDFHVFRSKEIIKLTKQVVFKNPNEYEGGLQMFEDYPRFKMASFHHSVLVNSPTNVVQNVFQNRHGEQFGISAKELNEKYLNGEVIDYDALSFENIVGCHQEIPMVFKRV